MAEDHDLNLIRYARRQAAKSRDFVADTRSFGRSTGASREAHISPDRFINYRLLGEIHRGGQGVVYKAIQLSTNREVAIKVLLEGPFAGHSDRLRFEREIKVLAGLRHPNIVTIHDSGTTAGFFYFVMDYIDGRPLDEYIKHVEAETGKQLDVDSCLKLCRKICDAINIAHLRGVIHRDLKPGNIRVDDNGEPQILDFGLAKLSDIDPANRAEAVMHTIMGQFVGSLPWASPEQSEGRVDEIDLRTDVYSIGVLMYQALTGKFPYPVFGNMREVADHIVNTTPKPLRTHRRDISDEVETIVLKCLSKEPERRYQSAGELSRDIHRYLKGDAIDAKRDSTTYLLKKQLRKHKLPFIFAATILVMTIGFSIWMGVLYKDARAARDNERLQRTIAEVNQRRAEDSEEEAKRSALTANETMEFLEGMFTKANPTEARGQKTTVGEMLDDAAHRLKDSLLDQPEVRLELINTIAVAYREMGRFEDAKSLLEMGLADHRSQLAPDSPLISRSLYSLARIESPGANTDRAIQLIQESLELRRRRFEGNHPLIAECLLFLGVLETDRDDPDSAITHLSEALEILKSNLRGVNGKVSNADVATCLNQLGIAYEKKAEFDRAEALYREAIDLYRSAPGGMHPDTSATLGSLALILQQRGDLESAEALLREALDIDLKSYRENHHRVAASLNLLGTNHFYRKDYVAAEEAFGRALEIRREIWGDDHDEVATSLNNLATIKSRRGDYQGARELYDEVLRIFKKNWGEDHSQIAAILGNIGALCIQQQKYEEAEAILRDTVRIARLHFDDHHPAVLTPSTRLGLSLLRLEHPDEAANILEKVVAGYEASQLGEPRKLANAKRLLGEARLELSEFAKAEELLLSAYNLLTASMSERTKSDPDQMKIIRLLVRLYEKSQQSDKLAIWQEVLSKVAE